MTSLLAYLYATLPFLVMALLILGCLYEDANPRRNKLRFGLYVYGQFAVAALGQIFEHPGTTWLALMVLGYALYRLYKHRSLLFR